MCRKLGVARSAYWRWKKAPRSRNEIENSRLAGLVEKIHAEHPDMGYRRICDELNARYGEHVNDKEDPAHLQDEEDTVCNQVEAQMLHKSNEGCAARS